MTDTSARSAARLTGTETGTDTVTDIDQEQDQEQGRDPRDGQPAPDVTRSAMAVSGRPLDATDTLFRSCVTIPQTPEASPDGQWIAYLLDDADGQTRLWLSPVDGGDAQAVSLPFEPVIDRDPDTGRLIRGPQWSPDGTTIALAGRQSAGEPVVIWLVPSPVSGTTGGDDVAPAAAASGESEGGDEPASTGDGAEPAQSAAAADAEADAQAVVQAVADPDEGTSAVGTGTEGTDADQVASRTSLADADQAVADAGAATSANGTADDPVSFAALGREAAPRQVRRLTNGTAPERSPRWSPNGETIAFVQTRDRRDVIALASPTAKGSVRIELLSWSGQDDREPAWSRDGKFLAFTRQRNDGPEHADIYVYTVATSELKNLTTDKASAIRHSLDWVPGRNLVGYVTREIDWLSISVINADNKAGWTVTRETGDKTDVRFAPKEARMLYIRTEGFATVCCERGLHASGSVALDPGEGTVYSPRWLGDKRVIYGFSAPQRPFGFLVQDNSASADRIALQVPEAPSTMGVQLRQPIPFEFEVGEDEQFSGLLYRSEGTVGPAPGIVYVPDGPLATRYGSFQIEEQALASTGMTVLTPVLHGATGFGAGVEQDLADYADGELEVSDLAEAGRALADAPDIDATKLALIGHGYGGTLALLTAGARPGVYTAVVAIDPITDWTVELDGADATWRTWVTRQYGLPRTNPDRYALRSPATFGAVIGVPLILVTTAFAPDYRREQFELFARYLDESGVAYERIDAGEEPIGATLQSVATLLTGRFRTGDIDEIAPAAEDATGDARPEAV